MFNNAPGFFTSVNLSIPENSQWELSDGMQVPHLCTLAFEFTYIGKENPTMTHHMITFPMRPEYSMRKATAPSDRQLQNKPNVPIKPTTLTTRR